MEKINLERLKESIEANEVYWKEKEYRSKTGKDAAIVNEYARYDWLDEDLPGKPIGWIQDTDFRGCDFDKMFDPKGGILTRVGFKNCNFEGCSFVGQLSGIKFKNCNLRNTDFRTLRQGWGVHIMNSDLTGADFRESKMYASLIRNCNITDVKLDGCKIKLEGKKLTGIPSSCKDNTGDKSKNRAKTIISLALEETSKPAKRGQERP